MSFIDSVTSILPEVAPPKQKAIPFKEKIKWTLLVLVLFFVLGVIPLFGLGENGLSQFEYLSIILGAEFGSLLSLGIGPIVTGSIILQLLNGSGLIKFDLTTHEGKQRFEGVQKIMSIFFIIFESAIFVFMGGLAPSASYVGATRLTLQLILILQLFLGGMIVLFMDEITSKWGLGSGISLFIAAGISKQIIIQLISFSDTAGNLIWSPDFQGPIVGRLWALISSVFTQDFQGALLAFSAIFATALVFAIAVYAQAMKVEIPLSFGRVRGHGIRWPLNFMYTSNIPVILVASLFATLQLWVRLLQNWIGSGQPICWIGTATSWTCFPGGFTPDGNSVGLVGVLNGPNLLQTILTSGGDAGIIISVILQSLVYVILMVGGAVLFSIFWVQTSGMDAESQANQIMKSGLQIPGFRKDQRIVERLLQRYIGPLTILGAMTVGFLAALADLTGALSRGTGILLTVMIIYKLYEDIARENLYEMNPAVRKFLGK